MSLILLIKIEREREMQGGINIECIALIDCMIVKPIVLRASV